MLTAPKLLKKIRAFYTTRSSNTVFIRTHHQPSPVQLLEDKIIVVPIYIRRRRM